MIKYPTYHDGFGNKPPHLLSFDILPIHLTYPNIRYIISPTSLFSSNFNKNLVSITEEPDDLIMCIELLRAVIAVL